MIEIETEIHEINRGKNPQNDKRMEILVRQVAAERDRAVDLAVQQSIRYAAEFDGLDIAESQARRWVVSTIDDPEWKMEKLVEAVEMITGSLANAEGSVTNENLPDWFKARLKRLEEALSLYRKEDEMK